MACHDKDMIENSPTLFLDEFQLPDRAANRISSNSLTCFFQLGGVLIRSNRMPDELFKATGMDFMSPPKVGIVRNWRRRNSNRGLPSKQRVLWIC